MRILALVLCIIGLISYAAAILNVGCVVGEIFSDIGNAMMLIAAVLLLLKLTEKKRPES